MPSFWGNEIFLLKRKNNEEEDGRNQGFFLYFSINSMWMCGCTLEVILSIWQERIFTRICGLIQRSIGKYGKHFSWLLGTFKPMTWLMIRVFLIYPLSFYEMNLAICMHRFPLNGVTSSESVIQSFLTLLFYWNWLASTDFIIYL